MSNLEKDAPKDDRFAMTGGLGEESLDVTRDLPARSTMSQSPTNEAGFTVVSGPSWPVSADAIRAGIAASQLENEQQGIYMSDREPRVEPAVPVHEQPVLSPGFGVEPGADDKLPEMVIDEAAKGRLREYLGDLAAAGAALSRPPGSRPHPYAGLGSPAPWRMPARSRVISGLIARTRTRGRAPSVYERESS